MAAIFEDTPQVIGGAFTSENCTLDLGGTDSTGAIVQRVQFTINRPINLIYELAGTAAAGAAGGQRVYYVGGRRQGTATFERIVGGSNIFTDFLTQYGPLCKEEGKDIILTAKGGCRIVGAAGQTGVQYKLKTPKLTTVGASVSAQEIVIMENLQMVFLDLDVTPV